MMPPPKGWKLQFIGSEAINFISTPIFSASLGIDIGYRARAAWGVDGEFEGTPEVSKGEIFGQSATIKKGMTKEAYLQVGARMVKGVLTVYQLDICLPNGDPIVIQKYAAESWLENKSYDSLLETIGLTLPADAFACPASDAAARVTAPAPVQPNPVITSPPPAAATTPTVEPTGEPAVEPAVEPIAETAESSDTPSGIATFVAPSDWASHEIKGFHFKAPPDWKVVTNKDDAIMLFGGDMATRTGPTFGIMFERERMTDNEDAELHSETDVTMPNGEIYLRAEMQLEQEGMTFESTAYISPGTNEENDYTTIALTSMNEPFEVSSEILENILGTVTMPETFVRPRGEGLDGMVTFDVPRKWVISHATDDNYISFAAPYFPGYFQIGVRNWITDEDGITDDVPAYASAPKPDQIFGYAATRQSWKGTEPEFFVGASAVVGNYFYYRLTQCLPDGGPVAAFFAGAPEFLNGEEFTKALASVKLKLPEGMIDCAAAPSTAPAPLQSGTSDPELAATAPAPVQSSASIAVTEIVPPTPAPSVPAQAELGVGTCDILYAEAKAQDACFAYRAYANSCKSHLYLGFADAYIDEYCSSQNELEVAPNPAPLVEAAPAPKRNNTQTTAEGLRICNETRYVQAVSLGYQDKDDSWVSEGWWDLAQNQCATVLSGELQKRYYYYRAEAKGGPLTEDAYMFCTSAEEYTIVGDSECEERGYKREGFAQIDTGPTGTYFVFTLTDAN